MIYPGIAGKKDQVKIKHEVLATKLF